MRGEERSTLVHPVPVTGFMQLLQINGIITLYMLVENRGMRVNMNKTKVTISGEQQKAAQNAVRWPCGVGGRGVGNNSIQCTRYPLLTTSTLY